MREYLGQWRPLVDETLEQLLPRTVTEETLEQWFGTPAYAYDCTAVQRGLVDPVWELLDRGGVRWRAGLFLSLVDGLGRDPTEYVEYACIPVLVHKGALIVDDVEDDADLRLHGPPIHEQYGTDVAVNAGTFCYFYPQLLMLSGSTGPGPDERSRLLGDFAHEMNLLHLGQTVDIQWHQKTGRAVDLDTYRQTCACKTGSLFRLAVRMATTIAGSPERTRQSLLRGATELAIAYQITDDRLDVYHSIHRSAEFGKEVGNDIIEGKVTPLVIHALETAPPADREDLERILTTESPTEVDVESALRILKETDSLAFAQSKADEHAERASEAFRSVGGLDAEARDHLDAFVDYAATGEW